MTQSPPTVSLHGLTKRYGSHVAVRDLAVEVPAGVVAGFTPAATIASAATRWA